MNIILNGKSVEIQEECSISEFLTLQNISSKQTAVLINSKVIPRTQHSSTIIQNNDHIEIVTLAAGG